MVLNDVIMAVGFSLQMLICVAMVLPLKIRKRKLLLIFPVIVLMYCMVSYFLYTDYMWWLAYLLETFGACMVIIYCDDGNVWRNYLIMYITFQGGNFLLTLEGNVLNMLCIGSFSRVQDNESNIKAIIEAAMFAVNTMIVALVTRKFFRKKYEGDGYIYKMIFFIVIVAGGFYGYIQKRFLEKYSELHPSFSVFDILTYIFQIIEIFLLMNIIVYAYNRLEITRLKKIKAELQVRLADNCAQYRALADSNENLGTMQKNIDKYRLRLCEDGKNIKSLNVLSEIERKISMLPLSGSISVDAVLSTQYERFAECGIVFEYHIERLDQMTMTDMDAAVLFDNLLNLAQHYSIRCMDERWVLVNARFTGNNLIVKTEFSKSQNDQLKKPKGYQTRLHAKQSGNGMGVICKIVQLYNGMLDVTDLGDEAVVSLLIQECTEG